MSYDYKKFAVLYVDDEEKSLKLLERAFSDDFRVLTAPNAQAGLKLLEKHANEIGVLMTDQRMPGEKGVWLLERARQVNPRILRMLVTAYSDMDAAISAVNSGAIYKYITKPWDPPQLEITIRQALEFFMVQMERDELLQEKMSVLRNMMIADRVVSLGLLAAGLSHNIRNSLVAVKTFLDLAPKKMTEERGGTNGLRNPDFWNDYHHNVQQQIGKINDLLSGLSSASDTAHMPFADKVSLLEIVEEAWQPFKEPFAARKIEFENKVSAALPPLQVDKSKFSLLFDLLFKEELATLPSGSRVTLEAEAPATGGKGEIIIRMSDNGSGLPQDALRAVFDPFVVRSPVQSEYGVHLMACFFIVHHHGGKIEAHSEPGRGTVFTIHLPRHPDKASAQPADTDFLQRAVLNEELWKKLMTNG